MKKIGALQVKENRDGLLHGTEGGLGGLITGHKRFKNYYYDERKSSFKRAPGDYTNACRCKIFLKKSSPIP